MERVIRDAGAVPAASAILHGAPHIGLSAEALDELAEDRTAAKASTATMAIAMARGMSAGTTVSGTLRLAAAMGQPAPRVFATGGIGGVHLGWPADVDVSADLGELARSRVCTVCAGPKSIIDAHATSQALESLGVPVLGLGVHQMPGFQSPPADDAPAVSRVDNVSRIAAIATAHWQLPAAGGMLVVQPPPPAHSMDASSLRTIAETAEAEVRATGPDRTPALLDAMARLSGGDTLRCNVDLLVSNARTAADIATALAQDHT
jgi:pseudouridine-5'-phosphate glycosidase